MIRYECAKDCSGNFTVDAETGYVILKSQLDAEDVNVFTFAVIAKDQGLPPLSAKAIVVVHGKVTASVPSF